MWVTGDIPTRAPALPAPRRALSSRSTRRAPVRSAAAVHRRRAVQALGDSDYLGRFKIGHPSLKGIGRAIKKGVKDTGHEAGRFATSKVGQVVTGAALAATGVGLIPGIAIGAAVKGGGALAKKGGNLKKALTGAEQGAITGAAGSLTGKVVRAGVSRFRKPSAPAVARPTAQTPQVVTPLPTPAPMVPTQTLDIAALPAAAAPSVLDLAKRPESRTDPDMMRRIATTFGTDGGGDSSSALDQAGRVLKVGKKARQGADSIAARIEALSAKLEQVQNAASAAGAAGDAVGAGGFSELAQKLAAELQAARGAGDNLASDVRTAGAAAEGAAGGAVAGAATQGFSDFMAQNKGVFLAGTAALAALVIVPRILPQQRAAR